MLRAIPYKQARVIAPSTTRAKTPVEEKSFHRVAIARIGSSKTAVPVIAAQACRRRIPQAIAKNNAAKNAPGMGAAKADASDRQPSPTGIQKPVRAALLEAGSCEVIPNIPPA